MPEILVLRPAPKNLCAHDTLRSILVWPHNGEKAPRLYSCENCGVVTQARVFERVLRWDTDAQRVVV